VSDPRDLLRSYLRQRAELGDAEIVLQHHSPAELNEILSPRRGTSASWDRARTVPEARPTAPPSPVPPRDAPPPRREAPREEGVHVRAGAPVPGTTPMPQAPDAPTRGVQAGEIVLLPTLDAVREVSLGCPRCRLAETRTKVVFGEGSPDADVMVVGEAPGADEDRSGRPFVGRAGKLLDLLLMTAGLEREKVYICNVLKCRPPGNRNPLPDEVEACSPYLLRQVELVKPRAIVAFGTFAAQTLLGTDVSIGRLRGKTHQYQGVPLVPTYHPAALLRNPGWVRAVWEDLQRVRAVLDRPS
jgi:uracil-DNA glycosylase